MRRGRWIALGCALLACVGLYFLGLRWVERSLIERLKQRDIVATVGAVELRLNGVAARDVRWDHDTGLINGRFDEVRAEVGWSGLARVSVHGGDIELKGSVQAVRDALRGKRAASEPRGGAREGVLPLYAEGLQVKWTGVFSEEDPSASELTLHGLVAGREQGELSLRVDRVQARSHGLHAEAELLVAAADSEDLGLRGLQVQSARAVVDLHAFDRVGDRRQAGAPGSDSRQAQPLEQPVRQMPESSRAAGKSKEPLPSDASGRAEGGVLGWVRLNPGRGARLRDTIQRAAGIVRRRLPPEGALQVGQVSLTLKRGQQSLSIGPGRVYGEHAAGRLRLGFASGTVDEPRPFEISAEIPVQGGHVQARVRGGPLSLSALGIKAGDFGLQEVGQSTLTVDSQVTLSEDGARADFSSSGMLQQLAIQNQRLAPHALTGINVGWETEGHFNLDGSQVSVKSGRVRFGNVEGTAELELMREDKRLAVDLDLRIEDESCAEMLAALPDGAVPLLAGSQMEGQFSWRGGIKFDTDRLTDVDATWTMRNRCRFAVIPDEATPEQFRSRFSLNVPGSDGELIDLTTGPGTRNWTPIQEISPFLEVAVLTTEDAGFWNHRGFDSGAIESAIRRNVSSGKFTRGASTISMQLAKNLYLERDKYVARKVQEALLTMLLEQELRKHQILELYFNVIEYGPGVYGIRQAAKHYFNSMPGELSLAQCFFLASLLPKPKAQYFEEDGNLSANRARLVRNLMKIAHKRNRISAEDLERGLEERLRFGMPHLESNPYRNPDGSTIDAPFYPGGGADLVDELP